MTVNGGWSMTVMLPGGGGRSSMCRDVAQTAVPAGVWRISEGRHGGLRYVDPDEPYRNGCGYELGVRLLERRRWAKVT